MWQWTGVHGHACAYAGRELCWGHTHAQCSAQRQRENSCGREAAEQQVSAAACTKASWAPAEQSLSSSFPEWKSIEGAREFTTFALYCLTVGQSWDASVKVMLGVDAVVHMYRCQIVPVILCPRYLESFPCAMTVRSECLKVPSGDTDKVSSIYCRLQLIFKEFHSSSHLCPGSFYRLNLKCPTSTKLGSKHCCSSFIVSNESNWYV